MRVSLPVLAHFPTLLAEASDDHLSAFLDLRVNEVGPPLEHVSSLFSNFGSVVDIAENHCAPDGLATHVVRSSKKSASHGGIYGGISGTCVLNT